CSESTGSNTSDVIVDAISPTWTSQRRVLRREVGDRVGDGMSGWDVAFSNESRQRSGLSSVRDYRDFALRRESDDVVLENVLLRSRAQSSSVGLPFVIGENPLRTLTNP